MLGAAVKVVEALSRNTSRIASTERPHDGSGLDAARNGPTGGSVTAGGAARGSSIEPRREGIGANKSGDRWGALVIPRPAPPTEQPLSQHNALLDNPIATLRGSIRVAPQSENDGEQVRNLSEQARPAEKAAAGDVRSGSHADIKIIDVEAQESGKLSVLGQAKPGATVGLYLNDAYIASAIASPSGRVAFSIGRGVVAGDFRVRLDLIDGAAHMRSDAEHSFTAPAAKKIVSVAAEMPQQVAAELPKEFVSPEAVSTAVQSESARSASGKTAERSGPVQSPATSGAGPTSSIPSIETKSSSLPSKSTGPTSTSTSTTKATQARKSAPRAPTGQREVRGLTRLPGDGTIDVRPGDNLWNISRSAYGEGVQYPRIYNANRNKIREPDLIFPGQTFVLPAAE